MMNISIPSGILTCQSGSIHFKPHLLVPADSVCPVAAKKPPLSPAAPAWSQYHAFCTEQMMVASIDRSCYTGRWLGSTVLETSQARRPLLDPFWKTLAFTLYE